MNVISANAAQRTAASPVRSTVLVHGAFADGSGWRERLNGEIKRRTDVVGIFPNEAVVVRFVDAILLEQSDDWATRRSRYMTLETIGAVSNTPRVSLSAEKA